jgi:hypothetical protein
MNDVIMKEKSEKIWNAQTRNLNVETKGSINEKKESEEIVIWKLTLKSYMLKNKIGNFMEKIFMEILLCKMLMQQLILKMHKSCIVYFVIKIQEHRQGKDFFYYKANVITSF